MGFHLTWSQLVLQGQHHTIMQCIAFSKLNGKKLHHMMILHMITYDFEAAIHPEYLHTMQQTMQHSHIAKSGTSQTKKANITKHFIEGHTQHVPETFVGNPGFRKPLFLLEALITRTEIFKAKRIFLRKYSSILMFTFPNWFLNIQSLGQPSGFLTHSSRNTWNPPNSTPWPDMIINHLTMTSEAGF